MGKRVCVSEMQRGVGDRGHSEVEPGILQAVLHRKEDSQAWLSVKYNDAAIQKYRKRYAGFFYILTNVKMDSGELLEVYRRKDVVENCFDDLKSSLDMKRFSIRSSATMDSRLFIQFFALILTNSLIETWSSRPTS